MNNKELIKSRKKELDLIKARRLEIVLSDMERLNDKNLITEALYNELVKIISKEYEN